MDKWIIINQKYGYKPNALYGPQHRKSKLLLLFSSDSFFVFLTKRRGCGFNVNDCQKNAWRKVNTKFSAFVFLRELDVGIS